MMLDVTGDLSALLETNGPLLAKYEPRRAIDLLDSVPAEAHYHHVPGSLSSLWAGIEADFGERGFETFQRIVLLELISQFEARARGLRYTDSVLERFRKSLSRIQLAVRDDDFEHYRSVNDILLKDLAICRQKVFPAGGARVVETNAGFPRSLALKGGVRQAATVAWLLARLGGNRPFYSHHTHLCELEEFTPEGFRECNLRLADMLELNPQVKGIHCGSWLYDPALETASPHLAYMRRLQADNGAYVFRANVNLGGGALEKSKTRRALYEQGKYTPTSYHVIWPRAQVIAWARSEG